MPCAPLYARSLPTSPTIGKTSPKYSASTRNHAGHRPHMTTDSEEAIPTNASFGILRNTNKCSILKRLWAQRRRIS